MSGPLEGKSVAVLIETEFIPFEIDHYKSFFESRGATVDFISNLRDRDRIKIIGDITDTENPADKIDVRTIDKDIAACKPEDYAIILVAANYVACRLREIPPTGSLGDPDLLATPPAVRFFADAMRNKSIVKGALCHGLWLLTPVPELLKGRRVICHTVVLADIHNAGALFVPDPSHVVVDADLVTARSAADLEAYTEALMDTSLKIQRQSAL